MPPPDSGEWREWRDKVDRRLQAGEERFRKIEENAGRRHAELLGAIEGSALRRKATDLKRYGDEDDDDISGITDVNELKRKARMQREKARAANRWKKYGKAAAPIVAGLSIAFWEALKAWFLK